MPEGLTFVHLIGDRGDDTDDIRDWVLGDEVYGADRRLRMMLEAHGQPYLLAIRGNDKLWSELDGRVGQHKPEDLAEAMAEEAWQRLSAGAGAKGEHLFGWARVRLVRLQESPWEHWLLVLRSIADPEDLAYFVVFGPATARLIDLARVAGRRWIVESASRPPSPRPDQLERCLLPSARCTGGSHAGARCPWIVPKTAGYWWRIG